MRTLDKQTVVYTYKEMTLDNKKEQVTDTCKKKKRVNLRIMLNKKIMEGHWMVHWVLPGSLGPGAHLGAPVLPILHSQVGHLKDL